MLPSPAAIAAPRAAAEWPFSPVQVAELQERLSLPSARNHGAASNTQTGLTGPGQTKIGDDLLLDATVMESVTRSAGTMGCVVDGRFSPMQVSRLQNQLTVLAP